jgi:Mor family transcriptional regulator
MRPKTGSPNLARDQEIYRLHIEEGLNVGQLAVKYELSKARIFSICWSIKKLLETE